MPFMFDGTYFLIIIGLVISLAAQAYVKSTFSKFSEVASRKGYTATQAAHYIYCGNKKVVRSDYLIDDNVKQLHQFRGTGILYTAHFNHKIEAPFTRIDSWTEAHGHFIDNRQHRIEETRERRVKAYEKSLAALK